MFSTYNYLCKALVCVFYCIKSSKEGGLCSRHLLSVSDVSIDNLGSLGVQVHRGQGGVLISFRSREGSRKRSLGFSNLSSVLDGEGTLDNSRYVNITSHYVLQFNTSMMLYSITFLMPCPCVEARERETRVERM